MQRQGGGPRGRSAIGSVMASRTTTRRRPRARSTRRRARPDTARHVRAAAARAVDRILASADAFEVLVQRLEAAGWHIEREGATRVTRSPSVLTPPARAR